MAGGWTGAAKPASMARAGAGFAWRPSAWPTHRCTADNDDKVIINAPETAKALDYCKALSDSFIPGVASWNDSSNNKAFLAGELYCTSNGISIYVAAKDDPTQKG